MTELSHCLMVTHLVMSPLGFMQPPIGWLVCDGQIR